MRIRWKDQKFYGKYSKTIFPSNSTYREREKKKKENSILLFPLIYIFYASIVPAATIRFNPPFTIRTRSLSGYAIFKRGYFITFQYSKLKLIFLKGSINSTIISPDATKGRRMIKGNEKESFFVVHNTYEITYTVR